MQGQCLTPTLFAAGKQYDSYLERLPSLLVNCVISAAPALPLRVRPQLDLSSNRLDQHALVCLSELVGLRQLGLADNGLAELPLGLARLSRLTHLSLRANRFCEVGPWGRKIGRRGLAGERGGCEGPGCGGRGLQGGRGGGDAPEDC